MFTRGISKTNYLTFTQGKNLSYDDILHSKWWFSFVAKAIHFVYENEIPYFTNAHPHKHSIKPK